jgi:tripartite-type tricarboxylate transporter receptor subunit TctC
MGIGAMGIRAMGGRVMYPRRPFVPVFLLALLIASGAHAQSTGTFAGKNVTMYIGFGPGGGYDMWARVVAAHLGKHLPGNPAVTPENMQGGGSYRAAGYIYNVAPKDGTAIAAIARDAALGPLTGEAGAQFDATKLSYLGTPATETNICIAYNTAAVKTAQDLIEKELIVGDTGRGTGTYSYPVALNAILGMKFKRVGGYQSSADVFLAMERGEVQGICESLDSVNVRRPDWISSGTVAVLFQGGTKPNPSLKGVPFVVDLAKSPEDKQAIEFLYAGQGIGRPFIAPPGLPPERLKMLRDAFDATMQDPEFIAEANLRKLVLDPASGEQLQALIAKTYATPRPVIDRIAKLIN